MTYVPNDDRNSKRHYVPQADYSNTNYDDLREKGRSRDKYGMPDERLGHAVNRHGIRDGEHLGRSSMGDNESYRRYEQGNRMYDNDYSTGFAGSNFTSGTEHFGEDSRSSNSERWQGENRKRDRNDDNRRNR